MRYTRYDYKRYGRVKFLAAVVIISGASIFGGLCAGNFIFKGNIPSAKSTLAEMKNSKISNLNITALQCGCYSKKENADKYAEEIKSVCSPFIVEDNSKYRVIAGLYKEENITNEIKNFTDSKIETSKVKFSITSDNSDSEKYLEVLSGFIEITDKLQESDVKSIKTVDFKKWVDKIIGSREKISDVKLKRLIECINQMPEELTKNNISDYNKEVFQIINEK